ncbi:MAG: hypothetical protein BIFFINMI_03611 [Phycisphaerae bacterium]|nr:hypothetical protein [Phycisphaerae bacterium]
MNEPTPHAARAADPGTLIAPAARLDAAAERFAELADGFSRAVAACAPTEADYLMGGSVVRVRVAGEELADAIEACLGHLRCASAVAAAGPAFRIDVWDAAATGVAGRFISSDGPEGVEGWCAVSADARHVAQERFGELSIADRRSRRTVARISDARAMTIYERARPLYYPLCLAMWEMGHCAIHAGMVAAAPPGDGGPARGCLVAGASGSGKSSTVLSCVEFGDAGLRFVSDDHIWLQAAVGGFVGHGLWGSVNLTPPQAARFGELARRAIPPRHPADEKSLLLLRDCAPGRVVGSAHIAAMAFPQVRDIDAALADRIPAMQAMLALAPSSMLGAAFLKMPDRPQRRLGLIGDLVAVAPGYRLGVGRDRRSIADAVARLLAEGMP